MIGRDARHTGQSTLDTSANNGQLKWKFYIQLGVDGSPVIAADGTIYVAAGDGYLYAINPDGTEKWKSSVGAFDTFGNTGSSPAVGADGTIYVQSANVLYAVNPDGSEKWTFPAVILPSTDAGAARPSSAVIGSDGTIYATSFADIVLSAFNPDGSQKWTFSGGDLFELGVPAIGADGTIYVGSVGGPIGNLYALNPDGSQKWTFSDPNAATIAMPSIGADGTIYAGADDGYLYALNSDGSQKWKFITPEEPVGPLAIGADGTVYVGSDSGDAFGDGILYALGPLNLIKWKSIIESTPWGLGEVETPVLSVDGTVYAAAQNGDISALVPGGSQKWSYFEDALGFSPGAIGADGTIYFGAQDGLYAVGVGQHAALNLSTTSINFGIVSAGGTYMKSFVLKNLGDKVLGVVINSAPPFKVAGTGSLTLPTNAASFVTVTFAPTGPGAAQGTVVLSGNDGEVGSVGVSAVAQGPAVSVPVTLNFGIVKAGQSKALTLSIEDSGLGALTGNVDASGLKPPFAAASGTGKFTIANRTSRAVMVRFAPRAAGPFSGTITITSNDPNHPSVSVSVSGSGG
jgi:outer membrane protein assembly factor BamB